MISWCISFAKQIQGKNITKHAAAVSYYLTLSLFPFVLCLNWLIGAFNMELWAFIQPLTPLLPQSTTALLHDYLAYIGGQRSLTMLIGGLLFLITSSSSAFKTLYAIIAEIQGKKSPTGILEYIFGFACSTVILFTTFMGMLVTVATKSILTALAKFIPFNLSFLHLFNFLGFAGQFLFLLLLLYLLYRYPTREENRRQYTLQYSVLISALLLLTSFGFSTFLHFSTRYPLVYGSIASIIALMTWIYICCNLIIGGSLLFICPLNLKKKGV